MKTTVQRLIWDRKVGGLKKQPTQWIPWDTVVAKSATSEAEAMALSRDHKTLDFMRRSTNQLLDHCRRNGEVFTQVRHLDPQVIPVKNVRTSGHWAGITHWVQIRTEALVQRKP